MRKLHATFTPHQCATSYVKLLLRVCAELARVGLLMEALHRDISHSHLSRQPAFEHVPLATTAYQVLPSLGHFLQLVRLEHEEGAAIFTAL